MVNTESDQANEGLVETRGANGEFVIEALLSIEENWSDSSELVWVIERSYGNTTGDCVSVSKVGNGTRVEYVTNLILE